MGDLRSPLGSLWRRFRVEQMYYNILTTEEIMLPSAERLLGEVLDGGWKVITPVHKDMDATGGFFSKCYIVENARGEKAFLKALDYSQAFRADDPALALQTLTAAFNFEREVLAKCRNENLDHVVVALADGTVRLQDALDGGVVQYLIFELADGDVRRQVKMNEKFDVAWSLRSLHQVAIGLQQLHGRGIAHQDLKPSNVLVFSKRTSKIADFGRSAYQGHFPPHEDNNVAGDLAYAPPELLYGHINPDWNRRRFGCDAYLMGSMTLFFFLGVGATPLLRKELPEAFAWGNWKGTFEEALPYLHDGFQRVLENFRISLPISLRTDLSEIAEQLCNPDPQLRGHPRNRRTNQFSMQRYVSKLDLLARRAELGLIILD
jgi:eukaryotic-like serine/threonine-protein kinase